MMHCTYVKMFLIISLVLLVAECGKPRESTTSKAVEDVTGMTAIKQGEKMKEQLKEVEKAMMQRSKEADSIE
jgi:hypothetical protein